MKTRKLTVRAASGALLALALLAPAAAPTFAKGSGSLSTTTTGCTVENQNHYVAGEWVYLKGADFDANTSVHWSIEGLPGGASTDPNQVVMSGNGITDSDGGFCFEAYQVAQGDSGEYKATVEVGKSSKSDNYRVEAPRSDETSGGGGSQDQGSSDQGSQGQTPTQTVQGITRSGGSASLPATDTISSTSTGGSLGFLLVALGALAGAAVLFAPSRRRADERA